MADKSLGRVFRFLAIPPSVIPIGIANVVVFMTIFSLLRMAVSSNHLLFVVLFVTYFLSTLFAYFLNRKLAYRNRESHRHSYLRFSVIYFLLFPVNVLFLEVAMRITGFAEVVLQWFWIPAAAALRIVLIRFWVFKP